MLLLSNKLTHLKKYNLRSFNTIDLAAFWGTFYLFFSMNPFPMWIIHPFIIYILNIIILFIVTLYLITQKKLNINAYTISLFSVLSIIILYLFLPISENVLTIGSLLRFLPFLFIVFFPLDVHFKIFKYFLKLIIFFSGFSILIFFLILIGIEPPYYKIDGFTLVMQNGNHYYSLYGLVVTATTTTYNIMGLTIARVCGPFQEPGHFAIYIGTILSIEKVLFNKLSKLPIIAGFLTFSPAFIIILILIILYDIIFQRKFKLLISIILSLTVLMTIVISNDVVKQSIFYLTIGRNFANTRGTSLNNRTKQRNIAAYKSFTKTKRIYFGKGPIWVSEHYGILSDYRGFIFRHGIIGFSLSILFILIILSKANLRIFFLLFPIAVLILAHRFWMFTGPHIYLFMIIGISSILLKRNTTNAIEKNLGSKYKIKPILKLVSI